MLLDLLDEVDRRIVHDRRFRVRRTTYRLVDHVDRPEGLMPKGCSPQRPLQGTGVTPRAVDPDVDHRSCPFHSLSDSIVRLSRRF